MTKPRNVLAEVRAAQLEQLALNGEEDSARLAEIYGIAADEIERLQALCLESAHFMAEDFATPLEDSVVSPRYLTHYKALLALRCTDEPSSGPTA